MDSRIFSSSRRTALTPHRHSTARGDEHISSQLGLKLPPSLEYSSIPPPCVFLCSSCGPYLGYRMSVPDFSEERSSGFPSFHRLELNAAVRIHGDRFL